MEDGTWSDAGEDADRDRVNAPSAKPERSRKVILGTDNHALIDEAPGVLASAFIFSYMENRIS